MCAEMRYSMRLDKYLKVSRLIKRRTVRRPVANEACDAGRITVNGKVAKASLNVKPGDIIEISFGDKQVKVEVLSIEETYNKEAAKELYKML
jgi:ribosomal 50S subunit-recycling heat shock protein